MRKDVAVVALRQIFFGRTPALTWAQGDDSLTAGAKRCICVNTGRECCHQPWAGCERTCSGKSEKTAWTFETSGITRPATQCPNPRRSESSAAALWEPQTSNRPQFCLKIKIKMGVEHWCSDTDKVNQKYLGGGGLVLLSLRLSRVPHELDWDRRRTTAMRGRRLIAWTMARPLEASNLSKLYNKYPVRTAQ